MKHFGIYNAHIVARGYIDIDSRTERKSEREKEREGERTRTHTRARASSAGTVRRHTHTHTYTGWPESGVGSRREPLDQYATLPPAPQPPGTSVHPFHALLSAVSSLFLSLSLFLSSVSSIHQLAPLHRSGRVRPLLPPLLRGKGTIRWKRAFGRPKTREGNTSLSRIFRHTLADRVKTKKKPQKSGHSLAKVLPNEENGDVFRMKFSIFMFVEKIKRENTELKLLYV